MGTYELEIQYILADMAVHYSNLVDIGAADGFYCVGFVEMGHFKRSWALEASEAQRQALQELVHERGLSRSVTIMGAADAKFAADLEDAGLNWAESVLLCDIEGGEFDILPASLSVLSRTPLIIEVHPFAIGLGNAKMKELRDRIARTHSIETVVQRARELVCSPAIAALPDDTRWLALSEGRPRQMEWLVCRPIADNAA